MAKKAEYKTKQRKQMDKFLHHIKERHFAAADVYDYFKKEKFSASLSTVYRQLEELLNSGKIKKIFIDENNSTYFEYVGDFDKKQSSAHYHLKCEKCGKILHLDCKDVLLLEKHITRYHNFNIDPVRTVFYGLCGRCK